VSKSLGHGYIDGVSRDVKDLIREAAALPESDRAMLAGAMIESLDPSPTPAVKAAWSREIERRVREIENGAVELVDWETVRNDLFSDE
jgi:putative addiction module component (TIGR02574 family)